MIFPNRLKDTLQHMHAGTCIHTHRESCLHMWSCLKILVYLYSNMKTTYLSNYLMDSLLVTLFGDAVAVREFISLRWQWKNLIPQRYVTSSIFHCSLIVWKVVVYLLAECVYAFTRGKFSHLWSFATLKHMWRIYEEPVCAQSLSSTRHEGKGE